MSNQRSIMNNPGNQANQGCSKCMQDLLACIKCGPAGTSTVPWAAQPSPRQPNRPPGSPTVPPRQASRPPGSPTVPPGSPTVPPGSPTVPPGSPTVPPAAQPSPRQPNLPPGSPTFPPAAQPSPGSPTDPAAAKAAAAATAKAVVSAAAKATVAAAAADGLPGIVATLDNAFAAFAANPSQNLETDLKVAKDALSAAFLTTNSLAIAANDAAVAAAAAHAHGNPLAPPDLEAGYGYISCNGIVNCTCMVKPGFGDVVKCILFVVILGAVACILMKLVFEGKLMFGKKHLGGGK